jgi:hypothetical protein
MIDAHTSRTFASARQRMGLSVESMNSVESNSTERYSSMHGTYSDTQEGERSTSYLGY